MKKILSIFLFSICFFSLKAIGNTIYVDSSHIGGIQTGANWSTAFSNFQSGINAANAGDSIWVAKGTYKPPVDSFFIMKEGVKIFGGFSNTDNNFQDRNWQNNITILKGNNNSVIRNNGNNLTHEAIIDGFTITNGKASFDGGGMYNFYASPGIFNCIFFADSVKSTNQGVGGAIANVHSSALIDHCIFSQNASNYYNGFDGRGGGAINNDSSTVTITNSSFLNNYAYGYGGAVQSFNSVVTFNHCSFLGNLSFFGDGAGVGGDQSSLTIYHCYFENNVTPHGYGGGIAIKGDSSTLDIQYTSLSHNAATEFATGGIYNNGTLHLNIAHCNFTGNISHQEGGAISNYQGTSFSISDCSFFGNTTEISGGAIFNFGQTSTSSIANCKFIADSAHIGGGAILNFVASPIIANCVFAKNFTYNGEFSGQAICNNESSPRIVNCTFTKNTTIPNLSFGSVISATNFSWPTISNSIFWNNDTLDYDIIADMYSNASINYSFMERVADDPINHIIGNNIDPLFVDTVMDDFRLLPMSPCINFGINDSIPMGVTTDLAGNNRINEDTVDLGAYEFTVLADLGKDTAICSGTVLTLNADNGGSTYLWNTGDTSQTITVDTPGSYSVTVSNIHGTSSDTILVNVNALPIVNLGNDTTLTQGDSIILDAGNPNANYLWNTQQTTQTIKINTSGTFAVTVTDSNGCKMSDSITVSFNTGINNVNFEKDDWKIYPNPTKENIVLLSENANLKKSEIILTDILGKVVFRSMALQKHQLISLAGLKDGIYFLIIEGGTTFKIIKE